MVAKIAMMSSKQNGWKLCSPRHIADIRDIGRIPRKRVATVLFDGSTTLADLRQGRSRMCTHGFHPQAELTEGLKIMRQKTSSVACTEKDVYAPQRISITLVWVVRKRERTSMQRSATGKMARSRASRAMDGAQRVSAKLRWPCFGNAITDRSSRTKYQQQYT